MDSDDDPCHSKRHIDSSKSPLISAIMFAAGIFGNVAALVILEVQRRRETSSRGASRRALFHVFITALVVTDLAGTCLISPLVQLAYARNTTMYCPGTWCFIDMNPVQSEDRAYANLYATIMLVLVLAIVACNGFVVFQLFSMYQRRKRNGGSAMATMRSQSDRRAMSIAEEVEHLILLVFMTTIFIICTLPLVIRVYINSIGTPKESHRLDLIALRFISVNSIIDPWVFILLSPSVLHFFWASVCRAVLMFQSSMTKANTTNLELCRTSLDYTSHLHSVENL
ncbi:prostaglandin E receptor 2a (subtype EP2) isoform X2 [Scophthalmus maximus]|uniref:prostaglandin E receptor 2a (subtype EP2) isoform X2 n=1 Tax=Scophthalmus maximus TaxID=52904 RepID=UPI0015E11EC6|nr:prostaglandin E receptor 2a (subtype EP2) isoform X2 [Scophthalmus maximus]